MTQPFDTLEDVQALQRAITAQALAGTSLAALGMAYGLTITRIDDIVQRVCAHCNPDLYCAELNARLKAAQGFWHVALSLEFLREHRHAFGFGMAHEDEPA